MLNHSLVAGAMIAVGYLIQRLALAPLDVLPQSRRVVPQFQLIDFICLLIYIQAILGFCLRFLPGEIGMPQLVLGGTGLAAALLFCGGSVIVFSRAGIHDNWRRATCMLLALPGTAALILIAVGAVFSAMRILLSHDSRMHTPLSLPALGGYLAAAIAGAACMRLVSWWIAWERKAAP